MAEVTVYGNAIVNGIARTRVRFDRSIHVPEDEICFFVFDAPSRRVAAPAAQRAGLDPIRVVEAVSSVERIAEAVSESTREEKR